MNYVVMQPMLFIKLTFAIGITALIVGCQGVNMPKHKRPIPHAIIAKMEKLGMNKRSPIFVRLFKEDSELEIWKKRRNGKYALLKTYEICKWSGKLGPKFKEGDRQAPEGFYVVRPAQMNPKSSYHLSFNIGFPNSYDRAHGRTGSHLMVHGACSSRGCYAMEDDEIQEIYALAREAFRGGQREFHIHAFPFHMTAKNFANHRNSEHMSFWRMLKNGYDHFEVTQIPPKVDVCGKNYIFNAQAKNAKFYPSEACPAYEIPSAIQLAVKKKQTKDDQKYQVILAKLEAKEQKQSKPQDTDQIMLADQAEGNDPKINETIIQPQNIDNAKNTNNEGQEVKVSTQQHTPPLPAPSPANAAAFTPISDNQNDSSKGSLFTKFTNRIKMPGLAGDQDAKPMQLPVEPPAPEQ